LKNVVKTEFNIEGYPDERFMKIIREIRPAQATLVPDPPGVITSNAGWDTLTQEKFLLPIVNQIQKYGVRVSLFISPDERMVEGAHRVGSNRIELYTEPYAARFPQNKEEAVAPYRRAADCAVALGLGINAGHDLDLHNLRYLRQSIPELEEVSIGHALICDALYFGMENTIQLYLRELR
jgi:pyridoxine 5-phosphate synthase